MPDRRILLLLAPLLAAAPAFGDTIATLSIDAGPATAVMRPLPEGQRTLRLPALDYSLTVNADCGAELQVDSLSVSVADTTRTMDRDDVAATTVITIDLTVPSKQLAPVAIDGFCREDDTDASADAHSNVDAAVTAHLSLRCAGEQRQTILYASKPLGITLVCERDQAPSESPIAR